MWIVGNLTQKCNVTVVSRLIDRAGKLLVCLDLVWLIGKAIRMIETDEFLPERFEFMFFVFG